ncbi:MAG TPA: cytochrome b/b6 domain-containing protein [Xanthomonadaceae bacterium]|jgi:thiosulfate reductase cytochrome b subunit|nr:cytochrome b/b6 domain-containing protein [Xanthomonadaceae bacterium]
MAATQAAVEDLARPVPVPVQPPAWTIYRHRLPVRIMHWINVICMFVMVGSGLSIFNAHPHLYWGAQSNFGHAVFETAALQGNDHQWHGVTRIAGHQFDTDGVLGVSAGADGRPKPRAFPSWATLPGPQSLAMGRKWHFTFAWIFAINGSLYLLWAFASRHFSRDLAPTGADWRGFFRSVIDHAKFKHPHGEEATRYNILQKLAYLVVILVFGPGIVLMGLAMSPHMDSVLGWLVDLVGGRQSARTIHFLIAFGFIGFVLIHVFEVLISGVFNQLRSMITGYYDVPGGKDDDHGTSEKQP